jgi:hypothetical protein
MTQSWNEIVKEYVYSNFDDQGKWKGDMENGYEPMTLGRDFFKWVNS